MVEDKVEGCDPLHVPDGEGATLLYQQVNNLNHEILKRIWILLFCVGFQDAKKSFCLFLTVCRYINISLQ